MTGPYDTTTHPAGTHPAGGLTLELTLHMDSDWHCGTGLGIPGGVNKLVNTDHDGLPFVPGKTLTGVWRDACELAAAALDSSPAPLPAPAAPTGATGGWHAWVEFLFGSQPALSVGGPPSEEQPRPAALSVRPARYPAALAAALRPDSRRALRDAATFVRPGVKIDPDTGRAAEKFLRFEQMARCGVQLTARATLAGWSGSPRPDEAGHGTGREAGLDDEGRWAAAAVLLLGARLVESVGGKRRRGAGRCRLDVTQAEPVAAPAGSVAAQGPAPLPALPAPLPTLEDVAAWLRARDGVAPPVPAVPEEPAAPRDPARPDRADWEIIALRIHLDTPLIVQERTIGNAVRSLDFVPGSVLLPGVLRRLATAGGAAGGAAGGWDPDALARAGDLVVTNATVDVAGERGRPLPRTWFHAKDDKTTAVNRLVETTSEAGAAPRAYKGTYVGASPVDRVSTAPVGTAPVGTAPPEPGAAPVPGPASAPASDDPNPPTITIRERNLTIHTHNVIDDRRQRPTADVVGLYTYEALAAGSVLRAEVRVRAGLLPVGAHAALAGAWALGRSAKDDYGQVTVAVEGPPTPWTSPPISTTSSAVTASPATATPPASPAPGVRATGADAIQDGTIIVWLLSDVLIRDRRLRPSTDPREFADQLGARLGVRLELQEAASSERLINRATAVRRAESWQRSWGLPRPTLLGLTAGSVLTFGVRGRLSRERLDQVLAAGIGERTAEGFGQLAVDDPLLRARPGRLRTYPPPHNEPPDSEPRNNEPPRTPVVTVRDPVARETARVIEREAWRAHIRRASATIAADADGRRNALGLTSAGRDTERVNPTQLGGLRAVLSRLEEDKEIGYWLKRLAERWSGQAYQQAYQRIDPLLRKRSMVWALFGLGPYDDSGPSSSSGSTAPPWLAEIWALLGISISPDGPNRPARDLTITEDGARELREDTKLWAEAVRTLVTSCLSAHHRAVAGADPSTTSDGQLHDGVTA
ncbi:MULTISPECIES: RAMP superfamily CRISPR-associated protein [unclassified Frankia]|uniref:RAMP superfamily CRISPR-associated protein n=1 Tax=unclassified Frankia TaxID=2632575 RepID=UPI0020249519